MWQKTEPFALPTALQAHIILVASIPNHYSIIYRVVNTFFKKDKCYIDKSEKMMYDIKDSLPKDRADMSGLRQGRTSRGVSGALYLQPATAGMNPGPRNSAVSSDPGK